MWKTHTYLRSIYIHLGNTRAYLCILCLMKREHMRVPCLAAVLDWIHRRVSLLTRAALPFPREHILSAMFYKAVQRPKKPNYWPRARFEFLQHLCLSDQSSCLCHARTVCCFIWAKKWNHIPNINLDNQKPLSLLTCLYLCLTYVLSHVISPYLLL